MPMFTYKKDEMIVPIVNIYDKRKRKLKITYGFLALLLLISILHPPTSDYLLALQKGFRLTGTDNLYDYIIPLISSFIVCYVFFYDYEEGTYEILTFYTNRTFNFTMLRRLMTYILPLSLGSLLTGMIYFRNVSYLDLDSLLLSFRFTPNILFLSSLLLCITVYTKNSYTGLFVTLVYFIVDFLTGGRIFKVLSIGANSNNFFYAYSPEYYFLNRLVILFLSFLFLFLACKRSVKL